jgi:hypothetical protein
MEVGDCSLWHHLIFCQELENNGHEENHHLRCSVCRKSVWGFPVYRCLECNFLQHNSCNKPTLKTSKLIAPLIIPFMDFRSSHRHRHHLILIEEEVLEKNVVCVGCQEPPQFGRSTHRCSLPRCNFFLHQFCADLSHVIQHPLHPHHTLFLKQPSPMTNISCDACFKNCKKTLFYRCSLCKFYIDIQCESRWRSINADDCHDQHAFVSTLMQIHFTCKACGEEEPKGIAYLCTICRLMVHRMCTQFQHTIKTKTHHHPLTRTYSLRQVNKQDKVLCELCRKVVSKEYGAYHCKKCSHIAHLNCANKYRDDYFDFSATIESDASNSDDYRTHLVHLVEGIKLAEDPKVYLREIEDISHPQHNLILSNEKLMDYKRCKACMQFIISDASFYSCAQCNFFIHDRCTKLPKTIKRLLFNEYPLNLTISNNPNTDGLFWCHVCKRHRHGFSYRGHGIDDYNFDIQCCLIPDHLEHEGHPHPISIAKISFGACDACGENDKDVVKFVCTYCNKFILCIRCATLPLIARYEHDTHLLHLSYTREYDPEEYYCLICEEERDPDYWFYYCEECKFTAHPRCVIGENPCIEYGKTYIDENHWHPLTIVEKTKYSPPCDYCGKPFVDGVAVTCTQCKFTVHPRGYGMLCLEYCVCIGRRI